MYLVNVDIWVPLYTYMKVGFLANYTNPATNFMNSTEVQNPRRKLDDKCLCLS